MKSPLPALALLLLSPFVMQCTPASSETEENLLQVPSPTGDPEIDRPNIQAVFDQVEPGTTVQFEPGLYRLGSGVRLSVPDVTVLGHPEGTVLRGCDPEAFDVDESAMLPVVFGCTGFHVATQRQTIRNLAFEYAWHGIVIGPYPGSAEEAQATQGMMPSTYPSDGHRIEGNTFRACANGLRVLGTGDDLSVVRDNDFVDVFHAIGIYGAPLHFVDNRVTVEQSTRVPMSGHPASAIIVSPQHSDCSGHVIAGNEVEGNPGAIYVLADRGEICRDVTIRDNVIRVGRVPVPEAWAGATPTEDDSTMVGVPITLAGQEWPPESAAAVVEEIRVEGNQILGAEGIGILVGVSNSHIVNNTIRDIRRREPFPGINWSPQLVTWEEANGSAIWLSPDAQGNEISGNRFEGVEAATVHVDGDDNQIELTPKDSLQDSGQGNEITRSPGDA